MKMKIVVPNGSKRVLTVLATFAVLLGGLLGAAAATGQPSTAPAVTVVGERTEHAAPDKARTAGTLAAISYRHLWCGVNGDFRLNLTGLGAFDGQPVTVTVTEAGTGGSEFIASVRMRVNNVSVWAGNVTAWVTVEWGSPLCIWTHYLAI